jgi:hypothetical protein
MKTWIKILLALFVVGIAAAFLVYKYVYNKPHLDYLNAPPKYTMEARQLFDEFRSATDASSGKYNGQVVAVSAPVSKVESADTLVIAVFAFNKGDFGDEGIRCTMLPAQNDAAKKLAPGTTVQLKGYCTGYNGTDVILDKCSIINQ